MMQVWQKQFITQHQLPEQYISDAEPIFDWVKQTLATTPKPFCLGMNGAQGSGKSTLSHYLIEYLKNEGYRADCVSIDDFYLSSEERKRRAERYHPLFATRGVPGTHDISLAKQIFKGFKQRQAIILPRFDKSLDEPFTKQHWHEHKRPLDVLIFEGWCVGLSAEPQDRLVNPISDFERQQDPQGVFRRQVNGFLAADYQRLFSYIDSLIYLNVGAFERVYRWRLKQERQLIDRNQKGMSEQQVEHFIKFFQRLTQWGMVSLPKKCDLLISVNAAHRFICECDDM